MRFAARGSLVGVTIVGAKSWFDREGETKITMPDLVHVPSDAVAAALAQA